MSEIEKMYENVKLTNLYCGDDYIAEYMLQSECTNDNEEKCKTCDKVKISYPPFTAEKQIELIKWAARTGEPKVEIGYSSVYGYWVENYTDTRYYFGEQFDSALASLINSIWQDLTEEEKQQIKDILK